MSGGKTHGPWTGAQLQQAITRGEVSLDSLLWTPGMTTWTAARQVPEMTVLFPPPAPPV